MLCVLAVYLLLGLVCVLVVLETCHELPQMKRLSQRFGHETVRQLDCETANIIERDHLSDQFSDPSDLVTLHHAAIIPSVSEQAATLRRDEPPARRAAAGSVR